MIANSDRKVAYFSIEVGLRSKIPTYSGGLGVLAGDMLKTAADENFPMVGITLLSKYGYFFQDTENGNQTESPVLWRPDDFLKLVETTVEVEIAGEKVIIGAWLAEIAGADGFIVPLYFLHTDFRENSEKTRSITDHLYGGGKDYRLQQEIVLGIGGVRMLKALGFTGLEKYHMNEGHSAFLALELESEIKDKAIVQKNCIFTTHTPVPAGHDKFDITLVKDILEKNLFDRLPKEYIEQGTLNMTSLALDYSSYINGVAKKHTEISKTLFPNYPIESITNGVHTRSWVSPHFSKLYDKYLPGWRTNSEAFRNVAVIPTDELWGTHFECKKQIIDYANAYTNAGLDYDFFTIGWARRFTAYKRPDFLLENIAKLVEIAEKVGPIQIIYSGKAHPNDPGGKQLIKKTIELSKTLKDRVNMVYLENYDIYLAKFITAGVDAWLNTPMPPQEASGTSGMKCAANGVPHISILDGWWLEGYIEGQTGWAFDTNEDLCHLLEKTILPCFYNNKESWHKIMQTTIMINGTFFSAKRMLDDYRKQAYKM